MTEKNIFRGGLTNPNAWDMIGGNKGEIGSPEQPGKPGGRMTMTLTILDDTGNYREIDTATASADDLQQAYSYLLMMGDSEGAFPGSPAWRKAQPYAKQLRELAAEHPEIEAARKQARAVAWDRANSI